MILAPMLVLSRNVLFADNNKNNNKNEHNRTSEDEHEESSRDSTYAR